MVEWAYLVSPIEKTKDARNFLKLSRMHKGKKWDEFSEEYKSELKSKVSLIWIVLWMFIGLFTFQWAGFLALIIFNFLLVSPLSKLLKYSLAYTIIHWINSLIGFAFGVFVILNHYHLKIDLTQWFMSLVK
jgi:hypothetical protein